MELPVADCKEQSPKKPAEVSMAVWSSELPVPFAPLGQLKKGLRIGGIHFSLSCKLWLHKLSDAYHAIQVKITYSEPRNILTEHHPKSLKFTCILNFTQRDLNSLHRL